MDVISTPVNQDHLPTVLTLETPLTAANFIEWYRQNNERISKMLLESGTVMIRGAGLIGMYEFNTFMETCTSGTTKYLDGNAPRSKHTEKVYNASEYDENQKIHLHTEFSYSNQWPETLYFCCTKPALSGGATSVGNCRRVISLIDQSLLEEFERKQITYIRNLHDGTGFGPKWQDAFESDDRGFIEKYCRDNQITVEWNDEGGAKFIQTRPATRLHPKTGDKVWFNQVDQFFPQVYGEEIFEAMLMMCDHDVTKLPMYATYGDGTQIQEDSINEILRVLASVEQSVPWGKGDLMIVDNMLALHGRLPYTGEREVLVSLV